MEWSILWHGAGQSVEIGGLIWGEEGSERAKSWNSDLVEDDVLKLLYPHSLERKRADPLDVEAVQIDKELPHLPHKQLVVSPSLCKLLEHVRPMLCLDRRQYCLLQLLLIHGPVALVQLVRPLPTGTEGQCVPKSVRMSYHNALARSDGDCNTPATLSARGCNLTLWGAFCVHIA